MLGAIIGDIVGSRFEFNNTRSYNFGPLFTNECQFTDDTICTVAIADAILNGSEDYAGYLQAWCGRYPNPMGGYGASFSRWIHDNEAKPYYSFGNGAAMRVSPVAWATRHSSETIAMAIATAQVSHNHPEGIKGAIATALAISCLRSERKSALKAIESVFYNPLAQYKRGVFDETCQGTVPVALRIIVDSQDFEDAIRLTMRWGGDSDTLGAIVGAMAEALYGIPEEYKKKAMGYLSSEMKVVIRKFYKRYIDGSFKG
ncbi:MAG: ADP-ribosylglycohydrolase family protein [Prevotella sp.]|nr:ADP-ribosylglycohydrolase family protein [Prevotella sp.]